MLALEKIDNDNKSLVRRLIALPFRLYANHPQSGCRRCSTTSP